MVTALLVFGNYYQFTFLTPPDNQSYYQNVYTTNPNGQVTLADTDTSTNGDLNC